MAMAAAMTMPMACSKQAHVSSVDAPPQPTPTASPAPRLASPYIALATQLTNATWSMFWNPQAQQMQAPVFSAEAVASDALHNNGYVFWPTVLMLQALVDAERMVAGQYVTQIDTLFAGMEQYFDPNRSVYDAWLAFPGNVDSYSDDNALAAVALAEASQVTGNPVYAARAWEILTNFEYPAWTTAQHVTGGPGGIAWGTNGNGSPYTDRTASTQALVAVAALTMAGMGYDSALFTSWGRDVLTWITTHLQDPSDGLIRDSLTDPNNTGTYTVSPTKWTYNTGNTLSAFVLLYRLTGDTQALASAEALANAAINRAGALYDSVVVDANVRFWYDDSYFVHHLGKGLLELWSVTQNPAIKAEVLRHAAYAQTQLVDSRDNLAWRNWRLWTIDADTLQKWTVLTGQQFVLQPDLSERAQNDLNMPVAQRPMVKTLLGCSGMARFFWTATGFGPPSE